MTPTTSQALKEVLNRQNPIPFLERELDAETLDREWSRIENSFEQIANESAELVARLDAMLTEATA